jgi:hypothetical protein
VLLELMAEIQQNLGLQRPLSADARFLIGPLSVYSRFKYRYQHQLASRSIIGSDLLVHYLLIIGFSICTLYVNTYNYR